ncbi:uncharacterized protein LOC128220736 [Mya arenaria]|uniref:uncharacterized protein LOC128220736 n=1 Tax=Mya arenaria TaxID=6604 RepID=UPI0022E69B64|nr:uncharacterized protein LOC128220736 [Mya arenaria]
MVKRCSYGTCNTDSRYTERLENDIKFYPFPKPGRNLEKCIRWLRLCGRPNDQLNLEKLKNHGTAKHVYVCSKHFVDGQPTTGNPDPLPALPYDHATPARRPPKLRAVTEPSRKRLRLDGMSDNHEHKRQEQKFTAYRLLEDENDKDIPNRLPAPATENMPSSDKADENRLLDMLALAAENESLKQHLAKLILENEKLQQRKTND